MKERPVCCVADQFCLAAANFANSVRPQRIAECFVCGEPVCTKCSTRRKYGRYGRVRICNNCQIEVLDGKSDKVVMRRLIKMATED
jgi:hypothetical protein